MTSMGDLGREIDDMKDHPQSLHPTTNLDDLEARLHAFYAWANGRPHPEIRSRFESDFSADALHDDVVAAIGEGRGHEVRDQLPVPPAQPGS